MQRGRLVHGVRSLGEVGHTVIDWRAWRDGLPSTLEELGSGSGIARRAGETGCSDTDAAAIVTAASRGETDARAICDDAVVACAIGVSNLVMAFYPSAVVIGGGLGRHKPFFSAVRDRVLGRPEHHPADLTIVCSALGDDAAPVGRGCVAERCRGHLSLS